MMRRRLTAPVVLVILDVILALLVPGGTWALDARSQWMSAVASPPTVTSVSPDRAYNYQETGITITGVNFTATPAVTLGNVPLSDVTFISSTTLTATVPADLPGGDYTLTVTNPDSQSASLANAFTVLLSGDGSLSLWESVNSMTTARRRHAAVQASGHLYSLGGSSGAGSVLSSVERTAINADGSLSPWQATTSMNTARFGLATVQVGNYIYAIGGDNLTTELSTVERAMVNSDGSLGPWQATTSMTTARASHAAVQAAGYIYAIGGNAPYYTASVERAKINSDGSLGNWEAVASMTIPRAGLTAVVMGSYLYAIGGQSSSAPSLDSVERAEINADGSLGPWETASSLTKPNCSAEAVAAGGYVYALGGSCCTMGVGPYDSVERAVVNVDGSLGPWQVVTSMTVPRNRFAAVRGGRYVYAIGGQDNFGTLLSSVERAQINFDITAPTADGLTINGGALNSTSTTISVTLSASDDDSGLAGISFSNDGTTWGDWQDYSTHASWSLSTGDGSKTVYGRVRDSVGYVSSIVSDTISLDTTAPAEHGLSINDGAPYTNKVTVTLTIGAQPGTAQMQVSNEGNFADAEWEPYASRKSWQVTQYLDYVIPRLVYVRYKDVSGNVSSTYLDDIIMDVNAPTGCSVDVTPGVSGSSLRTVGAEAATIHPLSISVTGDHPYAVYLPLVLNEFCTLPAGPANITLHLQAEDDLSGMADMMISHLPDCRCGTWEPYSTTKAWYVPDEATTIYVKFRDNAGNVSEVVTDTISW